MEREDLRKILRYGGLVLLAMFLVVTIWKSFVVVNSGTVGVVSAFGKISKEELQPGFHFLIPWVNRCTELNTQLKTFPVDNAEASSKDLQKVTTEIRLQHSLTSSLASEAFCQVGDIETIDANVVAPAVHECLKAITAQYTAEELITKRDLVKQEVVDAITKFIDDTLEDKGIKGACSIANVAITDFKFSDQFNTSIEAKVKASQLALQAVNDKVRKTTDAEAAYIERVKQADGEAYTIEQESIARADAITREAKALANNPALVRLRAIENWDGQLPVYTGGPVTLLPVGQTAPAPVIPAKETTE